MFNITAVGNLAQDPVQKEVNGSTVTSFTLLSTIQDVTTQFDCSVWGKRGDVVMDFIKKGQRITICGSASLNIFERRDGTAGGSVKVKVSDFNLPPKSRSTKSNDAPF